MIEDRTDRGSNAIVERVSLHRCQVLRHGADIGRNRHLVVVEDDDDVAPGIARIVQPFIRHAGCQCTVAQDGHDFELLTVQVARDRHAEGGRDGGGRMAGPERVVGTLGTLEKTRDAVLLAQGIHFLGTPGQQLVRVCLVPDVPHQLVGRRIENVVQRHRQLDDTEAGADMAAGPRAHVDQAGTHVRTQRAELIAGEGFEIGWRVYLVDQ